MQTPKRKNGFTLIEIMFVVLVILMLSGMLFKLGSIVKDRSESARAIADIENISNAISEYNAVYGQYPPATEMMYQFQDESLWSDPMQNTETQFEIDHVYGLVSYLYVRGSDDPLQTDDRDATAEQWQHYLADVDKSEETPEAELPGDVLGGAQNYSNKVWTIRDPWGSDYKYESKPPYLSYKLWSDNLE